MENNKPKMEIAPSEPVTEGLDKIDREANAVPGGNAERARQEIFNKLEKGESLDSQAPTIELYWPGWTEEDFKKLKYKLDEIKVAKEAEVFAKGGDSGVTGRAIQEIFNKLDKGESLDSQAPTIELYWPNWTEDNFRKLKGLLEEKTMEAEGTKKLEKDKTQSMDESKTTIGTIRDFIKRL